MAPFRRMITPGSFRMSVAMTSCGSSGWVTDRTGYRYDAVDPESGDNWPRMPGRVVRNAHIPFFQEYPVVNLKYLGAKVYHHCLHLYGSVGHLIGKLSKRYYFEDYVRVYPDGIIFNPFGVQSKADRIAVANCLNHAKVYQFAAQFVQGKRVADIGCGSGYGCEILKKAGAARVCGCDVSTAAIKFAESRYADFAQFTIQGMADLHLYPDECFDLTLSSEVLEHVKEYGVEEKAVLELKRVTGDGGLLIIGTPNSELLGEHGFYFDEINSLLKKHFAQYVIFENALVPFDKSRELWEKRLAEGKVGVIVSERIDISETCLPEGAAAELKTGIEEGIYKFGGYDVDTTLLHNTHSWLILAVNQKGFDRSKRG